jgi:hypothetical protein
MIINARKLTFIHQYMFFFEKYQCDVYTFNLYCMQLVAEATAVQFYL